MKIICIGRNYVDHAREMKSEVPQEPVVFLKPDTALLKNSQPFFYPDFSEEVHYEAEVVLRIHKMGKHIEEQFAGKYYDRLTLGIDFTARDIQHQCKKKGLPWEKAKAFNGSAATGEFQQMEEIKDLENLTFRLDKNGESVQEDTTANLLFSFDRIVSYVSQFFLLKTGDLIFTGTPSGVGPVQKGDVLEGFLAGRKVLHTEIK